MHLPVPKGLDVGVPQRRWSLLMHLSLRHDVGGAHDIHHQRLLILQKAKYAPGTAPTRRRFSASHGLELVLREE